MLLLAVGCTTLFGLIFGGVALAALGVGIDELLGFQGVIWIGLAIALLGVLMLGLSDPCT
jgi:hypothetical protein